VERRTNETGYWFNIDNIHFLVSKMAVYMISWQTPANLWDGDDCVYRISSGGRQYGGIVAKIHILYIYQACQILKVGMISTITVQI
jgi:hypothetical protein